MYVFYDPNNLIKVQPGPRDTAADRERLFHETERAHQELSDDMLENGFDACKDYDLLKLKRTLSFLEEIVRIKGKAWGVSVKRSHPVTRNSWSSKSCDPRLPSTTEKRGVVSRTMHAYHLAVHVTHGVRCSCALEQHIFICACFIWYESYLVRTLWGRDAGTAYFVWAQTSRY